MSEAGYLSVKRHAGIGQDRRVSARHALKTVPTKADMQRAFDAIDAKLTRLERQIDAVLERQIGK